MSCHAGVPECTCTPVRLDIPEAHAQTPISSPDPELVYRDLAEASGLQDVKHCNSWEDSSLQTLYALTAERSNSRRHSVCLRGG